MDGHFVPNITIGAPVVGAIRRHFPGAFLDVHLMISDPDSYVRSFREAGASLITVHAEATHHLHRTIQVTKGTGAQVGVSLNPHTPESVLDYVLDELDLVLVMSVNPGFGGQKFIPMAAKIAELRDMIGDRNVHIEIDGGVDPTTAPLVRAAGADVLVAGSAAFKGGSVSNPAPYGKNIRAIRAAAE